MSSYTISIHPHRVPELRVWDHRGFFTLEIKIEEGKTVTLFFDTFQEIIALKNSFLSSFNNLRKELKYDR